MNVNEWGIPLAFSTAFNMSAFTTVSIEFVKPNGEILMVSNPDVSVPNVDLSTTLGLFIANKYALYTFQAGDVDEIGLWAARVIYDDATPQHLISDVATFLINP